jgi:hypothetical protein
MILTKLSVPAVQHRLQILGYDLGDEAKTGKYGYYTNAALRAFKLRFHLSDDDVLDIATWVVLLDASRSLGERELYLRMPFLVGHDVFILQSALSAMGFKCGNGWAFDPATERAVREFQLNMLIEQDGIVYGQTLQAIQNLRHVWEGKPADSFESEHHLCVRQNQLLESQPICIYGTDDKSRQIADKVSNLAQATSIKSQVITASALDKVPDEEMLFVGIRHIHNDELTYTPGEVASELKLWCPDRSRPNRLVADINNGKTTATTTTVIEQHWAVKILDAILCWRKENY